MKKLLLGTCGLFMAVSSFASPAKINIHVTATKYAQTEKGASQTQGVLLQNAIDMCLRRGYDAIPEMVSGTLITLEARRLNPNLDSDYLEFHKGNIYMRQDSAMYTCQKQADLDKKQAAQDKARAEAHARMFAPYKKAECYIGEHQEKTRIGLKKRKEYQVRKIVSVHQHYFIKSFRLKSQAEKYMNTLISRGECIPLGTPNNRPQ